MTEEVPFLITDGFSLDQRPIVTGLFWDAFKAKLGPVMRPVDRALEFLEKVADPNHAITALSREGLVIGVAGFKTTNGSFIGGGMNELCATYGAIGGLWRGCTLSLLERPLQPDTLLMDGIFVSETACGLGIGSALLSAIKEKAAALGYAKVRLDVIDTNPRARALYERRGFIAEETSTIGPLRHVFGFRKATTMVYTL